LEKLQH